AEHLSRRPDEAEDQTGDDRDPEAHGKTDHTAKEDPQEGCEERREREQHDDRAEREISARGLAPGLSQQRSAPLHRSPRPDLLEDQDRDDELRDDPPRRSEGPRDDPPEETESLGDRPQDEPDRRGHQPPPSDAVDLRPRDLQAIRDRRVAATEPNHGGAHHRGVEINRDEKRDEIEEREGHGEEPITETGPGTRGE